MITTKITIATMESMTIATKAATEIADCKSAGRNSTGAFSDSLAFEHDLEFSVALARFDLHDAG
jgi:hypothetical protein